MALNMNKVEHQRLRKMLADLLAMHANRVATQGLAAAQVYSLMTLGLIRFCNEVLVDVAAARFCEETHEAMYQLERATILCGRAAA